MWSLECAAIFQTIFFCVMRLERLSRQRIFFGFLFFWSVCLWFSSKYDARVEEMSGQNDQKTPRSVKEDVVLAKKRNPRRMLEKTQRPNTNVFVGVASFIFFSFLLQ
jgi:hypothetical protein